MSRDRQPNEPSAGAPKSPAPSAPSAPSAAKLTGWKLWRFRLVAAFGVPIALLVVLELGLRLFGFGYPIHFLLPLSEGGRDLLVQNNQFGWRFFGPAMAREP